MLLIFSSLQGDIGQNKRVVYTLDSVTKKREVKAEWHFNDTDLSLCQVKTGGAGGVGEIREAGEAGGAGGVGEIRGAGRVGGAGGAIGAERTK